MSWIVGLLGGLIAMAVVGVVLTWTYWDRIRSQPQDERKFLLDLSAGGLTALGAVGAAGAALVALGTVLNDSAESDQKRAADEQRAANEQFRIAADLLTRQTTTADEAALVILSQLITNNPNKFTTAAARIVGASLRQIIEAAQPEVADASSANGKRIHRLLENFVELEAETIRQPRFTIRGSTEAPTARPIDLRFLRVRSLNASLLSGKRVDLSGATLIEADFASGDFRRAAFDGARLDGSNFQDAKLMRASMSRTRLTGARFAGANLTHARMYGADLSNARLTGAILACVDFNAAELRESDNVDIAELAGAMVYDNTSLPAYIARSAVQGVGPPSKCAEEK